MLRPIWPFARKRRPRRLQSLADDPDLVFDWKTEYPTGAEKASEMFSYISTAWSRLGRPRSQRVVEVALRFAEARRDGERAQMRLIPAKAGAGCIDSPLEEDGFELAVP